MRILVILILCSLSFSVSSQNDSTKCFTLEQVKVFLITKVELNNCLERFDVVSTQKEELSQEISEIKEENTGLQKKVKRNRGIAIGTGGGLIALLVLFFSFN